MKVLLTVAPTQYIVIPVFFPKLLMGYLPYYTYLLEETNDTFLHSLTNENLVNNGSYPINSHASFFIQIAHKLSPLLHIPLLLLYLPCILPAPCVT